MPVLFTLKVDGSKLDSMIRGLGEKIRDWTEAWPKVSLAIQRIFNEQFASEGARGPAGPWPELKEGYARRKQRVYPGRNLLEASGRLRRSLVSGTDDTLEEFAPRRMRFGTTAPYALYHQRGTKKMPPRKIFDLGPEDYSVIGEEVKREALRVARESGFESVSQFGEGGMAGAREPARALLSGEVPVAFPP